MWQRCGAHGVRGACGAGTRTVRTDDIFEGKLGRKARPGHTGAAVEVYGVRAAPWTPLGVCAACGDTDVSGEHCVIIAIFCTTAR